MQHPRFSNVKINTGDRGSVTCRGLVMHEPKTYWKLIQTTKNKPLCSKNRSIGQKLKKNAKPRAIKCLAKENRAGVY
jgi:hypothetical protein